MPTEIETLKMKKRMKKASPKELTRLKLLQDGEPLSKADLEVAKKREEERAGQDREDYEARQEAKTDEEGMCCKIGLSSRAVELGPMTQVPGPAPVAEVGGNVGEVVTPTSLDPPPEHPRIVKIKDALRIFTRIEAHDSRPDDFVLFTRDVSITAGDVRRAREAMKL